MNSTFQRNKTTLININFYRNLYYYISDPLNSLPKLTVAVGNRFNTCSSFNPHNFTRCGDFHRTGQNSKTQKMTCDEPVYGRYVSVYGDVIINVRI